jgi:glycosyltransferase involved in cell wall biosynthesis
MSKGLNLSGCEVKIISAFPHYPLGDVPRSYRSKALLYDSFEEMKVIRVWIPSIPHRGIFNRLILHFCFMVSSLFPLFLVGEIDVIWAANPNFFSFFPALIYGLFKRKPIVRNVDDLWPEVFYDIGLVKSHAVRKILDFLSWLSYSVSTAITPISQAYKTRIVEKYRIEDTKINVIEGGVGEEIFERTKNEDKTDVFKVMYSGILGGGYDFETVINSAKILSDDPNIHFVIRGLGPREFEIKEMIKKLDLQNITLSTAYVSKSKLTEIMNSANVFLLPMKGRGVSEEGLPTKIYEYQAVGKPIICASRGEPARYVKHTRSGLIVKPRDPIALTNAILKLRDDEEAASELGLNGWRYVHENLTIEKIGHRMFNLFRKISCYKKK